MYAIIVSGSRQYQVRAESIIAVNRLALESGSAFETDKVLLLDGDGAGVQVGRPYVTGAVVRGRVLEHYRGTKVLVFKHKRRKNYRRTRGHRQELTRLRIESIELGGKALAVAPALVPKPARVTVPKAAEATAEGAPAAAVAKPKGKAAPKKATPKAGGARKQAATAKKPAAKAAAKSPTRKATAAKPGKTAPAKGGKASAGRSKTTGAKRTGTRKSSKD